MKSSEFPVKLHLGSGSNVIPGWQNVDLEPRPGTILHDLTQGLPYQTNSVEAIFSEHVIEHFDKLAGYRLLSECYRVLRPDGGFRIGWPDLTKLIRAYLSRRRRYKRFVDPHLDATRFGTWDERLSDCLFSWSHRYAYTGRHLASVLVDIGFREVRRQRFMDSGYGILHDVRDDPATTYLEATK